MKMSAYDAVDGSSHWHRGAKTVTATAAIKRGVDGELSQIDLDEEFTP